MSRASIAYGERTDGVAVEVDSFFSEVSDIAFPDTEKIKKALDRINIMIMAIPQYRFDMFEKNDSVMYGNPSMIYLMFGAAIEFRDTFDKPDSAVYFAACTNVYEQFAKK